MTSSTVVTIVSDAITTFWGYLTPLIPILVAFGIGLGVLAGAIYFVLRRLRVIG